MAQGYLFGAKLYAIGPMPLYEKMRAEVPEVLQLWFADYSGAAGKAVHNAKYLEFLMFRGPKYG